MKNYVMTLYCDMPTSPKIASFERDTRIIDYEDFCRLKDLCITEIDLWEIVNIGGGYLMLVAEDGLLRELPINPLASLLYDSPNPYDCLVGDAVIVHRDEFNPEELRFLDEGEIEFIDGLLNKVIDEAGLR